VAICTTCGGSGKVNEHCTFCAGKGFRFSRVNNAAVPCEQCEGSGRYAPDANSPDEDLSKPRVIPTVVPLTPETDAKPVAPKA
jgi:hypothetical protein